MNSLATIPGKPELISDIQRRLNERELVSVLFIDLDGFKAVNDTMNHAKGDECLMRVTGTITAAILGKGKLYRPGGDEFVVVLPNFNGEEAASTAERIRTSIDADNPAGTMKVTASVGVASSESTNANDADALVTLADETMYLAKEKRNCVAVAPVNEKSTRLRRARIILSRPYKKTAIEMMRSKLRALPKTGHNLLLFLLQRGSTKRYILLDRMSYRVGSFKCSQVLDRLVSDGFVQMQEQDMAVYPDLETANIVQYYQINPTFEEVLRKVLLPN